MQLLPVSILIIAIIDFKCEQRSIRLRMTRMSPLEKDQYSKESLYHLFRLADSNNSGHIDPGELNVILHQLGWKTNMETSVENKIPHTLWGKNVKTTCGFFQRQIKKNLKMCHSHDRDSHAGEIKLCVTGRLRE